MKKLIYILALIFLLTACNNVQPNQNINENDITINTENEASSSIEKEVKKLTTEDYIALKVNEAGEIPVIMYHALVDDNPPSSYQRTRDAFKKDLQYFYDNNYRLISMKDYVTGNISVEAGCTPLVLTFDDGEASDFSLVEEDGMLVPTPNCAVAIIEDFAKEHPDFGKTAIFYINGGTSQFKGAGTYKERLEFLINNGYEIGTHTYNHPKLSNLSAEKVQEEIGKSIAEIREALPDYNVYSLAYPFGIRPQTDELRALVKDGKYKGEKYHIEVAFREAPSMPRLFPVFHTKFDPINAPRLRGNDDDKTGFDMGGYMKKYEKNPGLRYISDGDANTIVIPESEVGNISEEKIGDKKIITY